MNKFAVRFFYFLRLVADVAIVHLSFFLAHKLYLIDYPFDLKYLEHNMRSTIYYLPDQQYFYITIAGVFSLLLVAYNVLRRYYRGDTSLLHVKEYQHLIRSYFFAAVFTCTLYFVWYLYLKDEGDQGSFYVNKLFSRRIFGTAFLLSLFFVTTFRAVLNKFITRLHQKGFLALNCLMLGGGCNGRLVARRLHNRPEHHYRPVCFLDDYLEKDKEVEIEEGGQRLPVMGSLDDLEAVIAREDIRAVFFCVTECEEEKIFKALDTCCRTGVKFYFTPRLYLMPQVIYSQNISGITLLTVASDFKASFLYTACKRLFDILLSLVMLVLTSPVMVAVALAIRLDSRGEVFFKQERVGYRGRKFTMFKFRTMYADKGGSELKPTSGLDSRITKVGRFLRKTSLDELPQLINVLKGDMSFVGPRPEMTFIVDTYNRWQRLRLEVVPGITGLWQVSADRNLPIHENLDYDIYYIQERSFLLDLVIMMKTFFFVARGV